MEKDVNYKKAYEDLLYEVKDNISYLQKKSIEYEQSKHENDVVKSYFDGKAFAYKLALNKLNKSLKWLGIF